MARSLRLAPALLAVLIPGLVFGLGACAGPDRPALRSFEAALAARDSATAALEGWCAQHRLGDPPQVTATQLDTPAPPEPADLRRLLAAGPEAPLGYRHVQLRCGAATLSVAHNWYVPARLTPAMNGALATSRVPFGKVAAPLGYRRERLATLSRGTGACPPGTVLAHRALLRLPDGQPLALLVECYTPANLAR